MKSWGEHIRRVEAGLQLRAVGQVGWGWKRPHKLQGGNRAVPRSKPLWMVTGGQCLMTDTASTFPKGWTSWFSLGRVGPQAVLAVLTAVSLVGIAGLCCHPTSIQEWWNLSLKPESPVRVWVKWRPAPKRSYPEAQGLNGHGVSVTVSRSYFSLQGWGLKQQRASSGVTKDLTCYSNQTILMIN